MWEQPSKTEPQTLAVSEKCGACLTLSAKSGPRAYDSPGRNSYPDFRLVEYTEGYELKGLAYPGRDASYDCNSQVPRGEHNGRQVFYVFGRYPKEPDGDSYKFNLQTNDIETTMLPNPNAGKEHVFKACRLEGDPIEPVVTVRRPTPYI